MRQLVRKIYLKKVIILIFGILIIFESCKKEYQNEIIKSPKKLDESKVYKKPNTAEEVILVQNLSKVTDIFKELYKTKSNIKLVNAAIYSRTYTDESVYLKDLIYPNESILVRNKKFVNLTGKWGITLKSFSVNFWEEVRKKNDKLFENFLANLIQPSFPSLSIGASESNQSQQVTVYFPYSEQFILPDDGYFQPITSIVTATADADEGWGNLPFYDNQGNLQYYFQVLVNDDYAFENPTHIIGVNGIEPEPFSFEAPPLPTAATGVSRVFIGEVICKKYYDRLISFTGNGGGSDLKFARINGYLAPVNGQITNFSNDMVPADISRYNIRKQNWVYIYSIWDYNWLSQNNEQVLAIYEEDNTNSVNINGSLSTTLGLDSIGNSGGASIVGTIGFSINITSQDEIIRQIKMSRNGYFISAFGDQGHGFSPDDKFLPLPFTHGWPTYDVSYFSKLGTSVGWTMPYKLY